MKKMITVLAFILMSQVHAAETNGSFFNREYWCVRNPDADVTSQENKIVKIVIGHTVTDKGDAVVTLRTIQDNHMDNYQFNDIGYNFCLDQKGNVYCCRSIDKAPAILSGHNIGSVGIGCIGNFDDNEVSDATAHLWGKSLGRIAYKCGFNYLKHKDNFFAMSDLSERYPLSPGKHFMAQINIIIEAANQEIKKLNSNN